MRRPQTARFSCRCRGGVYAARWMFRQAGNVRAARTPQSVPAAHPWPGRGWRIMLRALGRRSTPQPLRREPLTGSRVKPPLLGEVAAEGRRRGGNVPPARNATGHAKPHGGVKTPPYRERERGYSTGHSRQGMAARAACRPPLRSNGNFPFTILVPNCRKGT